MKKYIALLLALVMVLGLAACGDKSPEAAPEAGGDEITVAGIVFQDDQFMNMLTKGYVDAANDAGVKILTDNTNNDQAKETELINTYLAQGVKGLAIAPLNGDASVAALRAADEKGMKVALTNINLSDADFIVAGYTSDDYTNCYLVARKLPRSFWRSTAPTPSTSPSCSSSPCCPTTPATVSRVTWLLWMRPV